MMDTTLAAFVIVAATCCRGREASISGFVEEVSCSAEAMTVVLNKTDVTLVKWLQSPGSSSIVYVQGNRGKNGCEHAVKTDNNNNIVLANFTIPYGKMCHVHLADLEPNFQTAETTIVLENLGNPDSKADNIKINHVFCLYAKKIEALNVNDIASNQEIIASVGGKPKPKVQMLFRDAAGNPLKSAKFGEWVALYLMLSRDNTYKAINPKHCMFSDRREIREPDAKTLTFVQSNCPVEELSEIIKPIQDINEEIYYTQFQAFRFGKAPTVYAHCTVEVCLQSEECYKKCFNKIHNSSLTTEDILLRFRRQAVQAINKSTDEVVAVSSALTVLDHSSLQASNPTKINVLGGAFFNIHIIYSSVICILSLALITLSVKAIYLHKKLTFVRQMVKFQHQYNRIFYNTPTTMQFSHQITPYLYDRAAKYFYPGHQKMEQGRHSTANPSTGATTVPHRWDDVQDWVTQTGSACGSLESTSSNSH